MAFVRGDYEEAVFSSSEDRIRASQASIAVAGHSIVSQAPVGGRGAGWSSRFWAGRLLSGQVAESLFSVFFPSDCRICGEPLLNISRLPVCPQCLASAEPIRGKVCSICGDRVLSAYAERDAQGLRRCPMCRRARRPFGQAVAYGSYESTLRELVHLLKYNGVRPAAKVLGRMLADAILQLPADLRQACLLRDVQHYSSQEVAERLGISVVAVRLRLFRARRRLREKLEETLRPKTQRSAGSAPANQNRGLAQGKGRSGFLPFRTMAGYASGD